MTKACMLPLARVLHAPVMKKKICEKNVFVSSERIKTKIFRFPYSFTRNCTVGECRRLFLFFVGDMSSLSAVVSVSWLSVNICCRRVVMSASCLSVSCHRFTY